MFHPQNAVESWLVRWLKHTGFDDPQPQPALVAVVRYVQTIGVCPSMAYSPHQKKTMLFIATPMLFPCYADAIPMLFPFQMCFWEVLVPFLGHSMALAQVAVGSFWVSARARGGGAASLLDANCATGRELILGWLEACCRRVSSLGWTRIV